MKHDFNLTGYLEGQLPESEMNEIQQHINECPICQEQLSDLKKSSKVFSELLKDKPDFFDALIEGQEKTEQTEILPLPESLKQHLEKENKSIQERFEESLSLLKSKGDQAIQSIAKEIEILTKTMLGSESAPDFSYALKRDTTLPEETELELRLPKSKSTATFKIQDYSIEIKTIASKTQIKIIKDGQPVSGIDVIVDIDKKTTKKTDNSGVVLY